MGDCELRTGTLNNMTFAITDTQRFSTHNGPGIRTTFFFKGCPLKCAWCHNPETLTIQDPQRAILGPIIGSCHHYTVSQILEIALKDEAFFDASNGGITLSGGEVLIQDIALLCDLLGKLKKNGLHIAIDTCGYVDQGNLMQIAKYVDLFLYDVKLMDPNLHTRYTGVTNRGILDNLKDLLLESKCVKRESNYEVQLRMPIIAGVNDDDLHFQSLVSYIQSMPLLIKLPTIALLPYHQMGAHKYEKMGLPPPSHLFKTPSQQQLQHFSQILVQKGFQVSIGG